MITLAIAIQKGGAGKTALTFNLGHLLAGRGWRVLLVDADPQATLSATCGIDAPIVHLGDVLGGSTPGQRTIADITVRLSDTLMLVPAHVSMANTELGMVQRRGREYILKRALGNDYDITLIDCPPSLSVLTINALAAADQVLIPCRPEVPDLRGLQLFLGTINELRSGDEINPALDVLGIVPTFYNSRLLHHQAALAELEELQKIGLPVLVEMAIGQTVRVPEALALGRPLHVYMPGNPQVRAFQQLADFVEVRCLRNEQPTRP